MTTTGMVNGPLWTLESKCLEQHDQIECWFRKQWQKTPPPFYGSVDLRNAGFKCAPVDTNLFPAGFNNLNPDFHSMAIVAIQSTIAEICPSTDKILVIPEDHTRNLFYLKNVSVLKGLIEMAGFSVRLGSIDPELKETRIVEVPDAEPLTIYPVKRDNNYLTVEDFSSCLVLLNNDLSSGLPPVLENVSQTILPGVQLGWFRRLKSEHFGFYADVAKEFAEELGVDDWLLAPLFDRCDNIDFSDSESKQNLKNKVEALLQATQKKYDEYGIKQKPFCVVKADSGTYGMAVMMIHDADEIEQLNRKQRTRMKTSKGGQSVSQAIIQEGVPTLEVMAENGAVAEPVVYLIGRYSVGGFYRAHHNKGPEENLNAPGMDFMPFAFPVACNMPEGLGDLPQNRCYAYSVVARLAFLAAARECAAFVDDKHKNDFCAGEK